MSALSQLERAALARLIVLDASGQNVDTPVREATAEALEQTLAEFFAGAPDEEKARGAVVVLGFARRIAATLAPQAVEEAVVEPLVPVEAPVAEDAVEDSSAKEADAGGEA